MSDDIPREVSPVVVALITLLVQLVKLAKGVAVSLVVLTAIEVWAWAMWHWTVYLWRALDAMVR